jgi:hypothetical protein
VYVNTVACEAAVGPISWSLAPWREVVDMTVLKRSTETRTGISVTRVGANVESYNILGKKIHVIDAAHDSHGILTHRWFSEVFDEEIKEVLGGHFVDEFITRKSTLILADLSQWAVSWDGVNEWLRDDLMPRLYAAGLRHLAVIVAPVEEAESNRFAAERFSNENPGINSSFTSEAAAVAWLKAQT